MYKNRRKSPFSALRLPQTPQHRLFHGPEDVLIPGAAAQMPGEELAQLIVRILLPALQNFHGGHNESRRAEPALDGGLVHKA